MLEWKVPTYKRLKTNLILSRIFNFQWNFCIHILISFEDWKSWRRSYKYDYLWWYKNSFEFLRYGEVSYSPQFIFFWLNLCREWRNQWNQKGKKQFKWKMERNICQICRNRLNFLIFLCFQFKENSPKTNRLWKLLLSS